MRGSAGLTRGSLAAALTVACAGLAFHRVFAWRDVLTTVGVAAVVPPLVLQIALRRVLVEVGAFNFLFVLRPDGRQASIERIVRGVEGANRRIRAALGEPYAKTSIGVPLRDLSEEEEEWVEDALKTFFHYWMREPA